MGGTPTPQIPKFPILCIPGIISRPDSRDSYPNIWENFPETRFDKNICKIQNFPTFFGALSGQGNIFSGKKLEKNGKHGK